MNIDTLRIAVSSLAISSSKGKRLCKNSHKLPLCRFSHPLQVTSLKLVICQP